MKRETKPDPKHDPLFYPLWDPFYTERSLDTLAYQVCGQPWWKKLWRWFFPLPPVRVEDINYFPPVDDRTWGSWLTDEKEPKLDTEERRKYFRLDDHNP